LGIRNREQGGTREINRWNGMNEKHYHAAIRVNYGTGRALI
jgi:hypothetical protein